MSNTPEENTVTVKISIAAEVLPIALSSLCRDEDAKCPLLALDITPPQFKCPFEKTNCADMSADDWRAYIARNLEDEKAIVKYVSRSEAPIDAEGVAK